MRLWKISYTSIAAMPDETVDADILVICTLAEQHNALHGITGILTLCDDRFAQVLEGPEDALRKLMGRIKADPRHHSVTVLADGPIAERRYASWSMAYRDPKAFVKDQINDLLAETAVMAKAIGPTRH
jgi:Sensors of blue-light using FAD